jgi:hypothetical protein
MTALKVLSSKWALAALWLLLPWAAQQDVYPLFRYGMFAEPVGTAAQQEQFWVEVASPPARALPLDPAALGLPVPTYRQLLRNYHYRGQGQLLLARLAQAQARQPGGRVGLWWLYRAVGTDTAQVASWPPVR